jgi:RNA polymerase sigma-70 factor (ECF subfamily)
MQVESTPAAVKPVAASENVDTSTLFRRHAQFVAGFLSRLGVEAADVKDVVQEVFVIVHEKGGYRAGPARPTTWLAEIGIRVAAAYRRKRAKRERPAPAKSSLDGSAFASMDEAQMFARVERALTELPENDRVVFVLFELEGEPCGSIAAALGVSVNTIYGRLHAARTSFKSSLEAQAGEGVKA